MRSQMGVLPFPGVQGLFGNLELPTDLLNQGTSLDLPHGIHCVLFGESRPPSSTTPPVDDRRNRYSTLALE